MCKQTSSNSVASISLTFVHPSVRPSAGQLEQDRRSMNWRAVQFVNAPRPQTLVPWSSGGSAVRSAVVITQGKRVPSYHYRHPSFLCSLCCTSSDLSTSDRVTYRIGFSPDVSVSDDSLAVQVCILGQDGTASLAYIPGETLLIVGVEDGQPLDCVIGDVGPPACVYLSAPGICVGRVHVEHVQSGIQADLVMGRKEELEKSGEEPIVMVARPRLGAGSGDDDNDGGADSAGEYRELSRDGLLLTAALTAIGAAGLRILKSAGSDDAAVVPSAFGLGGLASFLWLGSIIRRVGRLGQNQRQQQETVYSSVARLLGAALAVPITVVLVSMMIKQGGAVSSLGSNISTLAGDIRGWAERVYFKLDQKDRQAAVLAFAAGLIQFRLALLVANRKSVEQDRDEK